MLTELLNNESIIVRIGTAAFITFAPLYILADMGFKWAGTVAMIAFATILLKNNGRKLT